MDRIVSARVNSQRWYERFPRAVPLGAFMLAMAITVLAVMGIERVEADRRQAQVRAVASIAQSALARRATAHTAFLRAGAILMSSAAHMTQADFVTMNAELRADDEYRAAEGITWVQRIAPADVPLIEDMRRAEGLQGFTVHPLPAAGPASGAGPRADALAVVTYLGNPLPLYRGAYGYDMYSEPRRRAAMELAARTHRPAATGLIRLIVDGANKGWSGFMIYMPVYSPLGAPAARQHLMGYICVPFNAQGFLRGAPELAQSRNYVIRMYDGAPGPDHLLASVGPQGPTMGDVTVETEVAQRHLVLVVGAAASDHLSNLSVLTLAFGTLVATLVLVMARLVTRQAAEDRASLAWLREQATIRSVLTRELNHRVKNTLANVLSIIALTRRRSASLDDFADALDGRIRALSATHDLLTESEWGQTPLRAVMVAELAPYRQVADREIVLEGPDVDLAPNDALSLGLAVHELATNATKYGALSVPTGRVEVHWELTASDRVLVCWRELGGPPVAQEKRKRGFGTELIERIVAAELGGGVTLEFRPGGVYCELTLPVRLPATFMIRKPRKPA